MIRLGLRVLENDSTGVPHRTSPHLTPTHLTAPHLITGAWHPHDTPGMGTFLTWLLYYLPGFSTSELLFFGRKSLGVGRVDYTPPPGQGVIYIVCFYNSSVRKISFFSLLYFFIQSFIYITVFSCIFILYFGL